ncbi:hypothetical protein BGZ82_009892, partial [Podila clonocystis]
GLLNAGALYKCSGPEVTPKLMEVCKDSNCIVNPGNNNCTTGNKCKCPDVNDVCGHAFPHGCNLNTKALYSCSSKGANPQKMQDCPTGNCEVKVGNDACLVGDFCKCKDSNAACGNSFPDPCNLDKTSLYQCTGSKGTNPINPINLTKCKSGECNPAMGPNACTDPCKCKDSKVTCGNSFPDSCNLDRTSLYQCSGGKGTDPVNPVNCTTSRCIPVAGGPDGCKPEPPVDCKFNAKEDICGKVFKADCNYDKEILYSCTGSGVNPTARPKCDKGCTIIPTGDDKCFDDCVCPDSKVQCGKTLPPNCGFSTTDIYNCSADCGGTDCTCFGNKTVCSSQFPDSCTDSGTPIKERTCDIGKECATNPSGTTCGDCKCPNDGIICGTAFGPSCKIVAHALYKCTKGGDPVLGKSCLPGTCTSSIASSKAAAMFQAKAIEDKCVDPCTCPDTGLICGKLFNETCSQDATAIYQCNTVGGTPALKVKCPDGKCTVTPGDDHCGVKPDILPQCYCNDTTPMCSSSLDPLCAKTLKVDNVDPKQVYTCTGGKGSLPQPGELCKEDSFCNSQPAPIGAICKPLCNCTGTETKCSSTFTPICKLPPQGVYNCNCNGTVQVVQACTGTEICAPSGNTSVCILPECVCKDGLAHCGSFFPDTCKLEKETLYQCKNGEPVKLTEDCKPGNCSENIKPPSATSIEGGEGDFEVDAEGDAKCIKQCECKWPGPVCASTFDPSCNFQQRDLLACTAMGNKPTVSEPCTLECLIAETPDKCKFNPCECTKVRNTCGQAYPPSCGHEANTLYKCEAKGKLPVKGDACASDQVCKVVPGGSDICGPAILCECRGAGKTCSNQYQPDCKFPKDTIIICPGLIPTPCPDGCVDGECKTGCKCTEEDLKCGFSFAAKCNLIPNSLYKCAKGGDPVLDKACGNLACTKGTPDDSCTDPCKCKNAHNTCSGAFPISCGLKNNTLYKCTALGATPTELQGCTKGCLFTNPDNMCRLDCAPQVVNATDQIQAVIEEHGLILITEFDPVTNTSFKAGTKLTDVAMPHFINLLKEMKTNLTAAKDSLESLALIAGQISKTANGMVVVVVFQRIAATFPVERRGVLVPAVQELVTLLPLLNKVIECSGSNGSDCSGNIRLYHDFVNASITHMQMLAVLPRNVMMPKLIEQVKNVTKNIDGVLVSKYETVLNEIGKQLNTIISETSLNTKDYGDSSEVLELIYQSASEALRCYGLNVTVFADKCSSYGDRTKGFLSYIFQWFKKVVGLFGLLSWITDPIMDAIDQAVQDALTAASDTIAGVLGTIATLLDFLKIIAPADYQSDISAFLLKLVGIEAVAGDCGGKKRDCFGAITLVMALLRVIPNIIDKALFCDRTSLGGLGAFSPLCIPGTLINTLLSGIEDMLRSAAKFISGGIGLILDTVYNLACIKLVYIPGLCDILKYLKEAIKKIVDCLINQNTDVLPSSSAFSTSILLTFL